MQDCTLGPLNETKLIVLKFEFIQMYTVINLHDTRLKVLKFFRKGLFLRKENTKSLS